MSHEADDLVKAVKGRFNVAGAGILFLLLVAILADLCKC